MFSLKGQFSYFFDFFFRWILTLWHILRLTMFLKLAISHFRLFGKQGRLFRKPCTLFRKPGFRIFRMCEIAKFKNSVSDPSHFDVDPDPNPDPGIHIW